MNRRVYRQNLLRWREHNQKRIDCSFEIFSAQSQLAFHLVPFFVRSNHPDLPGYVRGENPWGISLYEPDDDTNIAVRDHVPKFKLNKIPPPKDHYEPIVQSLFLMGSIGTVGHTRTSDFDYWVVYDKTKHKPEQIKALKTKLAAIEKWLLNMKIEAYFFMTDITNVRANKFGSTDKESAGSAQSAILKEEFYRTAILVCGKSPLWWLLPSGISEAEYEKGKKDIFEEGFVDEREIVDMGRVFQIPPGELFGAMLWQFNKAMDNPYKSVIKMALMESYIMAGDEAEPLCEKLKRFVHKGAIYNYKTDPYMVMLSFIHKSFQKQGRDGALITIEKSFFMKCFDKPIINTKDDDGLAHKERAMRACVRQWKWDEMTRQDMNAYKTWNFKKIGKLAVSFHDLMLEMYKNLTNKVSTRTNVKSLISENDLTVLGRKLFTIYAKKPKGKITFLKRVMGEAMNLDSISFAAQIPRGHDPMWAAYTGNITSDVAKGVSVDGLALKKSKDLAMLMIWLTMNRVYNKNTFLYFIPNTTPLSLKDLQQLMEKVLFLFPNTPLRDLKPEDLVSGSYVTRMLVAVNFLSKRWIKEIETINLLYSNSWGEYFCHTIDVGEGLETLRETLEQTRPGFAISDKSSFDLFIPAGEYQQTLKKQAMAMISHSMPGASRPIKR